MYLRSVEPGIFTIADAKRGDIGPTNAGYVSALYDGLGCDAVTLHPYLAGRRRGAATLPGTGRQGRGRPLPDEQPRRR